MWVLHAVEIVTVTPRTCWPRLCQRSPQTHDGLFIWWGMGWTPWRDRTSCSCPQSDSGRQRSSPGCGSWWRQRLRFLQLTEGRWKKRSSRTYPWFATLDGWSAPWLSAHSWVLHFSLPAMPWPCRTQPSSRACTCGISNLCRDWGRTCGSDMCEQLVRGTAGLGQRLHYRRVRPLVSKYSVIIYQSPFYQEHNGFCQDYLASTI